MQHGCLTSGAKMAVASPHTWSTSAPSSCTHHQRSNAQQPRQASATTPRSAATSAGAHTHTHTHTHTHLCEPVSVQPIAGVSQHEVMGSSRVVLCRHGRS